MHKFHEISRVIIMTLVETQFSQLKTVFKISIYDLIVSGCDIMGKGLKLAVKEVCQLEDA